MTNPEDEAMVVRQSVLPAPKNKSRQQPRSAEERHTDADLEDHVLTRLHATKASSLVADASA